MQDVAERIPSFWSTATPKSATWWRQSHTKQNLRLERDASKQCLRKPARTALIEMLQFTTGAFNVTPVRKNPQCDLKCVFSRA